MVKFAPHAISLLLATTLIARGDLYSNAVTADSPFAYYRLNESSSAAPAADQAGSNSGTFVNSPSLSLAGPLASNPSNTAAGFNGTNQYVQLTSMGNFGSSTGTGFSVEYWLKTGDSTDYQGVLGTANNGFNTAFLIDIGYNGDAGRLRLYYRDDASNRYEANFVPTGGNINLYSNTWHQVIQVYDPAAGLLNDRIRFYIDGVRQVVDVVQIGANPNASNFNVGLTLGAFDNRGVAEDFLKGSLDEVALYKSTLSGTQISNHYAAATVPEPTLGLTLAAGVLGLCFPRWRGRGEVAA